MEGWRLAEIISPTATITFVAGNNREDIDNRDFGGVASTNPSKALQAIQVQSGSFCKKFELSQSYYVDASTLKSGFDNEDKRLKLNGVQEKSCDASPIIVPAYTFQYYENATTPAFLPNRLSGAIDHWGFYNGVSTNTVSGLNIPATRLQYQNAVGEQMDEVRGNANRESSVEPMKLGTLKKISYPTGGSTSFEYEANSYYGSRSVATFTPAPNEINGAWSTGNCTNGAAAALGSGIQTFNDPSTSFYKIELIGAYKYDQSCLTGSSVEIRAYNNSTNAYYGMYQTSVASNDDTTANDKPTIKEGLLSQLYPLIPAGVPIRFEIKGRNIAARMSFGLYVVTTETRNFDVGGLRVKKVTNNDGVSSGNDVVKSYTYSDPLVNPTRSSGLLYNNPVYGYVFKACINPALCYYVRDPAGACAGGSQLYVYPFFFENSVIPLGSFEGHHLGYSTVKESFNGSGTDYYNLYKYSNESSPGFTGVPVEPIQPRITSGQLSEKRQRNAGNSDIAYEIYQPRNDTPQNGQGTYIKFSTYLVGGNTSSPVTVWKNYSLATRPFRHESVQTFLDGQLVTVNKEYNSPHHLQVSTETLTNSDGKVTETGYVYTFDLPILQGNEFIRLNLLSVAETNIKVGGTQVKGSKTEFAFFDNASGAFVASGNTSSFIRPYQFKSYEGSGWVQKGQIDSYHGTSSATGRAGLPKQFTKTGWLPESYEWTTSGLIKKRQFSGFNWQYEYLTGTAMVSKITNPDGQFSEYTYDRLMRLDQVKARDNKVVTTNTYTYPSVNGSGVITSFGNVKSSTVYQSVAEAAVQLGPQDTFQYFDGLGRSIETVYKGKAAGTDQIVAVSYDNQGRVNKTFEPFAGTGSAGAYQSPGSTPSTLTEFEGNPLNRVWKVTPPSWATTQTTYASNSAGDGVLNYNFSTGSSTGFAANSLSKTTVIDGNGNKNITFMDKKGRMILSRKANSAESSKADTYYVYDDKDRLVRVIPPGAAWGDAELVFTYQYTDNDLISQKKVPGKAYEAYEYNSRDLPVKYQDPILRANSGRWMGSKYDNYGRLTEKGVYASGSGDAITLTNKIIENIYGTAVNEIDKLKTTKVQVFNIADPVFTPTPTPLNNVVQTTFNYDAYGRVLSTTGNNHTNVASLTAESVGYIYDNGDNILRETRASAHSAGSTNIVNNRQFDSWGRLTQASQNLNNAGDKIISQLSYTAKDQLNWKKLGNGLQQIDYGYLPNGLLSNINGAAAWPGNTAVSGMLTNFNTPTFTSNNNADLFREVLNYNTFPSELPGIAQQNGNIGQMIWQVRGRTTQAYSFTYDYLDRLTASKYSDYTTSGSIDPVDYFGESLSFDIRGNVTGITRKGLVKGATKYTAATIDTQTMTVQSGTNRSTGSTGPNSTSAASANMDAPHNHLNLPSKFDFGSNNIIELLYDGAGNKLKKTVKTNNVITLTQDYLDGIELKNNVVEAVYNEEGRAFNNAGSFRYEYALRDHLGNTRVVFTNKDGAGIQDNTEILSETHYYPFGKTMEGAWYNDAAAPKYKYLYNGKELSEEFNLNFYDYGARWLDPGIGSWWEVDPLSENNRRWSPYAYGNNNPIRFIDPDGRESSAYGGFTSSAEIAERSAASAEAHRNKEDSKSDENEKSDDTDKEKEWNKRSKEASDKYGANVQERISNGDFWMDLLFSEGGFERNPNQIQATVPDLPIGPSGPVKVIKNIKNAKRVVVLGESMADRVIPYAKSIGATWFKPRSTNPANWMKNQVNWIRKQIKDPNTEIINIGPDPNRVKRSEYFLKEMEMVKKYLGI